jgi:NitT/TauT family transport system substrate-binding protein
VIAVIIVIALAGLGAWYFLNPSKPYTGTPEPITVGMPTLLDATALVFIADDQHYFADNGLNVTIRMYETGLNAFEGMLNNESDIAIATEFVMVNRAFPNKNITGIGSISKYQLHYLIGRKDRGIASVSDLKGKKIGVAYGTSGDFYLGRFLELNGIHTSEITSVNVKASQYVDAIVNESVDGILAWDPYVEPIKDQLGSNVVVWPAQSGQQGFWMAICDKDWVARHPEPIKRFLKSLDQAAAYALNHPADAKAIVKKRLSVTDAYVDEIWPNTRFSLSLDQSLVTAMEDMGRWMINNNLTAEKTIPDYIDHLYLKGLKDVKPESVNIIG